MNTGCNRRWGCIGYCHLTLCSDNYHDALALSNAIKSKSRFHISFADMIPGIKDSSE